MGQNTRHTQTVIVMFMVSMILTYHVQFVMSLNVLQSTLFLRSTYAPQDKIESITVT